MNTIKIRNLEIGAGAPKIIVPLVGTGKEEIIAQARDLNPLWTDVAEWRVDWYAEPFDPSKVKDVLKELRSVLGDLPLLITFRTSKEGGEKEIDAKTYLDLNLHAIQSGLIDLIDIELFQGEALVANLITQAHAHGVKVIVSSHDFEKTPDKDELISRMCKMQDMGADIPKIAVMPQNKQDVLTLLTATEEMFRCHAQGPIITMSMSKTGVLSRLCGEVFGSSMTFGSAGCASAPGQPNVEQLHACLLQLHDLL